MFTCTSCGFSTDKIDGAKFCPKCRAAVPNGSTIIDSFPVAQQNDGYKSLATQTDQLDLAGDLVNQVEKMYLTREALEKDNPLWNSIGKHFSAYRYKRMAIKTLKEIGENRAGFLADSHKQVLQAELHRQNLILKDAIEKERFDRLQELEIGRAKIQSAKLNTEGLAVMDFLEEVFKKLESPVYANWSDEEKSDFVRDMYEMRKAVAFKLPEPPQNKSLTDSSFNQIETDFDE